MSDLATKIRRAREFVVEVGDHKFTCRRPTDEEAISMRAVTLASVARRFVIDWNLTGKDLPDLFDSGSDEPIPFSADLWSEVIADQPSWWAPITSAVHGKFKQYVTQRKEAEKK